MNDSRTADSFFENLAQRAGFDEPHKAPSRVKSRIYTALIRRQRESGPLRGLAETGAGLCIFEKAVAISPVSDDLKRRNPCEVCHARVLAERVERAPIYWSNCPYVCFQNR